MLGGVAHTARHHGRNCEKYWENGGNILNN